MNGRLRHVCGGGSQPRVCEEDKGVMVGLPGQDMAQRSSLRLAEVGQLPVRHRGANTHCPITSPPHYRDQETQMLTQHSGTSVL